MRAFVGVVIVVGFIWLPARAAVLYVGPGEAYTTIQAGIDAAADGDVVIVRDGTYTGPGNRDIDFKGKAIHLKSEAGPERCIVGAGTGFVFSFWHEEGTDSILDGFTIMHGSAGGVQCSHASPLLINNVVWDCGGTQGGIHCEDAASPMIVDSIVAANSGGGITCTYGTDAQIIGCMIQANFREFYGRYGSGILVHRSRATVHNCRIYGNASDDGGGGILLLDRSTCSAIGCTITNNDGGGIACHNSCLYVSNTLLSGNRGLALWCNMSGSGAFKHSTILGGVEVANHSHATFCNSIVGPWGLGISNDSSAVCEYSHMTWGNGNFSSDPCFADPANGDYHLKSQYGRWAPSANGGAGGWVTDDVTSPCINGGDPASDYSLEPQPNGGRVNMGAYGNTPEASKGKWILPGDANHDSIVNVLDLIGIRNLFMHDAGTGDNWKGDVNEDGQINVLDLIYARNLMGTSRP